jgi:hypothetical protein
LIFYSDPHLPVLAPIAAPTFVFTPALGVDAGLFWFGFGFGFSFAKLDSKFVVFVSRRLC